MLMKISIEDYETYALDYLEGRLDTRTRRAFDYFLAQHPHIRQELEAWSEVTLPPMVVTFGRKEALKKRPYLALQGTKRAYLHLGRAAAAVLLIVTTVVWLTKQPAGGPATGADLLPFAAIESTSPDEVAVDAAAAEHDHTLAQQHDAAGTSPAQQTPADTPPLPGPTTTSSERHDIAKTVAYTDLSSLSADEQVHHAQPEEFENPDRAVAVIAPLPTIGLVSTALSAPRRPIEELPTLRDNMQEAVPTPAARLKLMLVRVALWPENYPEENLNDLARKLVPESLQAGLASR